MKILAISLWLFILSFIFLIMNGTMDSYVHFNDLQSSFTPNDFLSYFFFFLVATIILLGLFVLLIRKTKLDPKTGKIVYYILVLFSVSWVLFSINLFVAYFLIEVNHPLGIIWYVIQLCLTGFMMYKVIKTPLDQLLNIIEE